jgi:hypothetical protein
MWYMVTNKCLVFYSLFKEWLSNLYLEEAWYSLVCMYFFQRADGIARGQCRNCPFSADTWQLMECKWFWWSSVHDIHAHNILLHSWWAHTYSKGYIKWWQNLQINCLQTIENSCLFIAGCNIQLLAKLTLNNAIIAHKTWRCIFWSDFK